MNNIDSLILELYNDHGVFLFPEFYSHTNELMWKVLNPYTKYKEDKMVLSPVKEGIEKALVIARVLLAKKEEEEEKKIDLALSKLHTR